MRKHRGAETSSGRTHGSHARDKAVGASRSRPPAPSTDQERGPRVRCAIYTRKSSEEGLEQEFNSLDAQREACEAFIKSRKHEGWNSLPQLYDDPGYSGGTMERPALKRLLADIAARRIDAVVVYKVDRLTRSLSDFAKAVEVFDAHSVSFVSITQAFNTTTSTGRLTLNVLLSFAQFEREVTGERIRDKIAASKKKGLWMGGLPSLGYDVNDRKLVVNEAEAATVRMIYRRYLELGSVRALKEALDDAGIVSKLRTAADGSPNGGRPFSRGALYLMLQNRIYRGEIVHKGAAHPGEHAEIVDEDLWSSVQRRLEANGVERRSIGALSAPHSGSPDRLQPITRSIRNREHERPSRASAPVPAPASQRRPYHRKSPLRLEHPKRRRMTEESSLLREQKMHPQQASAKTPQFDPLEVKYVHNINYLIRGGGGVRLTIIPRRSWLIINR
jgi:DNA invertase Pin-like site-specific DNA recombinase